MWFDCAGISRGGGLLANKNIVAINFWFPYHLPVLSACKISFSSIMCTAFLVVMQCYWCCVWALSLTVHHCVNSRLCGVVHLKCASFCRFPFVIGGSSGVSTTRNMMHAHYDNSGHNSAVIMSTRYCKTGCRLNPFSSVLDLHYTALVHQIFT
jgi:hypothetical protein